MSDRPTVPFFRRLHLTWAIFFDPQYVARAGVAELSVPGDLVESERVMRARVDAIRNGTALTFIAALAIGLAGLALGRILYRYFGASPAGIATLGATAGLMLLWATLGMQGWNIQSLEGNSLPERINQWIYRGLSIAGVFMAIVSAGWGLHLLS